MEKQMINTINKVRQNPTSFIPILQKQIQSFINNKELPLNDQIIYQTNQGKKAWQQALYFLKLQKPLLPLQKHQGLMKSSKDHALDLWKNKTYGHTGSDGSNFSQRILKYCRKGHGSMAELIGADFNFQDRNHAEMTILGLIIDDGVLDRGHRNTIFSPLYKYIGCRSQIQDDKIITVFNITENNLALRTDSSSLKNTSKQERIDSNQFKIKNMSNTANDNNFGREKNDDKFSKTQWISQQKQNQNPISYSKNVNNQKSSNMTSSSDNLKNSLRRQSGMTSTSSQGRKLREKKQSSKIYYEQGSKITQVTTKLVYTDGTVEQKIEKHTIYLQE